MSDDESVSKARGGAKLEREAPADSLASGDGVWTSSGTPAAKAARAFEGATITVPPSMSGATAGEDGEMVAGGGGEVEILSLDGVAAPAPGVRIHQYEMIKKIGEGGMGMVFLARDLRLGRRVAVKFLQTEEPELTQRFLVEARATARCQHDNIVVIHDIGEHGRAPFIVLELLEGKPLTSLLERGQRLPYARAVEIMIPILRALQCAHDQGIVHRDLKPDNVFLTDAGTVKVLDFGIAKVLREREPGGGGERAVEPVQRPDERTDARPEAVALVAGRGACLTRAGTIMGTLPYMAPEQWDIGVEIDPLTDIWAAGILLYRMICGRHPLDPLQGDQLVATAMLELPMPSLAKMAPPEVPRALVTVIDRCLSKGKAQRWQSAAELLAALEACLPGRRAARSASEAAVIKRGASRGARAAVGMCGQRRCGRGSLRRLPRSWPRHGRTRRGVIPRARGGSASG